MWFQKKQTPNLESLHNDFSAQSSRLQNLGYAEILGLSKETFQQQLDTLWNAVEHKAPQVQFVSKGKIPLLIVVPQGDTRKKMEAMKAHTELDLSHIHHHDPLTSLYVILDVEDGENQVAKSPQESLRWFEKMGRQPLDLVESMALFTHFPTMLQDHYVTCLGTRFKKEDQFLPLLWLLDDQNNPELHYAWFDIAHGNYGAASAAVKITN